MFLLPEILLVKGQCCRVIVCARDFQSPTLKIELERISSPIVFEQSP